MMRIRSIAGGVLLILTLCVSGQVVASGGEKPQDIEYRITPSAPANQTQQQAQAKSEGCLTCHTQSDTYTMHDNPAVNLGCTDCHGGDQSVAKPAGADKESTQYAEARDIAHVLPRYPETWKYPSSSNPKHSYTLLNVEAPEYVRFVNPSDYRVAEEACGACHLPIIKAAKRSLMSTGAMLWGGAAYNNGILPFKNYIVGEAYTREGVGALIEGPVYEDAAAKAEQNGILPLLYPLPAWETVRPGDVFRIFERGGRNIVNLFPETALPNALGQLQRLEEPGRPDIRQSNRGPGTGLRISVPLINITKTRLNDPLLWFLGTNDNPGRLSFIRLRGLPRGLCQRPRPAPLRSLRPIRPHRKVTDNRPDYFEEEVRTPAQAQVFARNSDQPVHDLPHAPTQHVRQHLPWLHHVGLRIRCPAHVARGAALPDS